MHVQFNFGVRLCFCVPTYYLTWLRSAFCFIAWLIMVNLCYTCCCSVNQQCPSWGVLYVKCLSIHTCCHSMRSWHFVDLNPSGSFNFLMVNIKWAVVLRECCLGGPLGFELIPFVREWLRRLILRPDLPFLLVISSHDFTLQHCTAFVSSQVCCLLM